MSPLPAPDMTVDHEADATVASFTNGRNRDNNEDQVKDYDGDRDFLTDNNDDDDDDDDDDGCDDSDEDECSEGNCSDGRTDDSAPASSIRSGSHSNIDVQTSPTRQVTTAPAHLRPDVRRLAMLVKSKSSQVVPFYKKTKKKDASVDRYIDPPVRNAVRALQAVSRQSSGPSQRAKGTIATVCTVWGIEESAMTAFFGTEALSQNFCLKLSKLAKLQPSFKAACAVLSRTRAERRAAKTKYPNRAWVPSDIDAATEKMQTLQASLESNPESLQDPSAAALALAQGPRTASRAESPSWAAAVLTPTANKRILSPKGDGSFPTVLTGRRRPKRCESEVHKDKEDSFLQHVIRRPKKRQRLAMDAQEESDESVELARNFAPGDNDDYLDDIAPPPPNDLGLFETSHVDTEPVEEASSVSWTNYQVGGEAPEQPELPEQPPKPPFAPSVKAVKKITIPPPLPAIHENFSAAFELSSPPSPIRPCNNRNVTMRMNHSNIVSCLHRTSHDSENINTTEPEEHTSPVKSLVPPAEASHIANILACNDWFSDVAVFRVIRLLVDGCSARNEFQLVDPVHVDEGDLGRPPPQAAVADIAGTYSTILVPLHLRSAAHWVLAAVRRVGPKVVETYDSLPSEQHTVLAGTMVDAFLAKFLGEEDDWTITPMAASRQDNSHDCGAAIVASAVHLLAGAGPMPAVLDGQLWRRMLACLLASRPPSDFRLPPPPTAPAPAPVPWSSGTDGPRPAQPPSFPPPPPPSSDLPTPYLDITQSGSAKLLSDIQVTLLALKHHISQHRRVLEAIIRLKHTWLKLQAQSAAVRNQEQVAGQQYQAQIKSKEASLELWRAMLLGDAVEDRITASQRIQQLDVEISALCAAQSSQAKRRRQGQGRDAQMDTVSHALTRLIKAMSGWEAKLTSAISDAALQRKKHLELGRALEAFAAE